MFLQELFMKGLDRTQLKLIAICAMVCDHTAWGFVEFMTPLGQVMHVIGRLTLPIMCFFVAEGFRHTKSVKEYLLRLALFSVVAALPFYFFFHELYDFRQNIIFDLMLGAILLAVLENKQFKVWLKVLLSTGLFALSAVIGGWVIMPMLYILVFYYVKTFKNQVKWFVGLTIALQVFLITAIKLNEIWHFSHYDWPWYDKLYLLGFVLPLFFLKHYNGQKGKDIGGRYFFYLFYPAHFIVLTIIRALVAGCTAYEIYVGFHVFSLMVCLMILLIVFCAKPSRGQSSTLLLVLCGCIYTCGFLVEITSGNVGGFYAATVMEYFGECILMVAFTLFMADMCHREVPQFIYAIEVLCGIFIMWMVLTTRENHYFYTYIGIDEKGPFPRLILEHGWGFGFFVACFVCVCLGCIGMCLICIKQSAGRDRKRIICTATAIACPWIPNAIRATGITGGYEIPCLGIMGAVILVGMALLRYEYFDSIALAGENALNHGQEGIMVVNNRNIITYLNIRMKEVFSELALKQNANSNKIIKEVLDGKVKNLEINDKIYEMRVEPLEDSGYVEGKMIWMLDVTEHHYMLEKIKDLANKDALTGIFNRNYFISLIDEYLDKAGSGSLFMMDLNHFRQVNDRFGHQTGDEILKMFGHVLSSQGEDIIPCRIGGDEFCLFCKDIIDVKELEEVAKKIMADFYDAISNQKYADIIDVSFGITRILEASERDFEKLYSNADKALYVAKNRSENAWYIL